MRPADTEVYLALQDLRARGWTEHLVRRFLGLADRTEAVQHWLNSRGRRLYFLGRVEAAEATEAFAVAYARSLDRRRIPDERRTEFAAARRQTAAVLQRWLSQHSEEDLKREGVIAAAAQQINEGRAGGLITPHKG
jgi:hypothetical protein